VGGTRNGLAHIQLTPLTGIDQVIPNFTGLGQALAPAPAAAPRPRRRRPKPGMRTRADRPPADPGARPQPGLTAARSGAAWAAAGSRPADSQATPQPGSSWGARGVTWGVCFAGSPAARVASRDPANVSPAKALVNRSPPGILICYLPARAGASTTLTAARRRVAEHRHVPGRAARPLLGSSGGRAVAQHRLRPLPCAYANRRTGRRKCRRLAGRSRLCRPGA